MLTVREELDRKVEGAIERRLNEYTLGQLDLAGLKAHLQTIWDVSAGICSLEVMEVMNAAMRFVEGAAKESAVCC